MSSVPYCLTSGGGIAHEIVKNTDLPFVSKFEHILADFVVKLYGFCLTIVYIARRRHPYIESLPTL